jgi:small-conductance mechanosensitive channel
MIRILSFIFFLSVFMLICMNPLLAQKDTNAVNRKRAAVNKADSEKVQILTNQNEEFRAIQVDRLGDSLRLLQLKKELELDTNDRKKKQALSAERDLILNRDTIRYRQLRQKVDSTRALITGFPVVLGEDTLFFVYARLGSLSAKARADVVSVRIKNLADDYSFDTDSLKVVPSDLSTDIVYNENVIKSVTDMDAIWENSDQENLARKYVSKISRSIKKYQKEHDWKAILVDISIAILVIAALVFILYFIGKFFRFLKRRIYNQRGRKFKGLKFGDYEVLDAGRQVNVLFGILNIVRWIVMLILVYITLLILLGIFPWTGRFSGKMFSYLLDPINNILVSIWYYLPNLITIVVLLVVFRYLLRILAYLKSEIEKGKLKIPGFYVDWANPTFQIVRVLILAFMVIVIFPYLPGSDSPIFKGVSVFLGVLFTFGSAGALSNIIAGLVLTYMRAYRIGDRIQIGQIIGDVVEKSLLVTRLKTIKNEIVSVPNSTVMSSHTTNFSADAADHGLILHTSVTIGYDAPWRKVHELLIKAALATELIEKDPAPFVFQESLNDFYVTYQINAYTHAPNKQHITYSVLHQNIQDSFNEAGVEIMSSHYSNIRDGNKTTIPAENLPKDYVAPSFRVKQTGKEE